MASVQIGTETLVRARIRTSGRRAAQFFLLDCRPTSLGRAQAGATRRQSPPHWKNCSYTIASSSARLAASACLPPQCLSDGNSTSCDITFSPFGGSCLDLPGALLSARRPLAPGLDGSTMLRRRLPWQRLRPPRPRPKRSTAGQHHAERGLCRGDRAGRIVRRAEAPFARRDRPARQGRQGRQDRAWCCASAAPDWAWAKSTSCAGAIARLRAGRQEGLCRRRFGHDQRLSDRRGLRRDRHASVGQR